MVLVEKYELYRTSQACCEKHFARSPSCKANSDAAYPPQVTPIGSPENTNPLKYFPDLSDTQNCVLGRNYDSWMSETGFAAYYLFDNASDCCKMWLVLFMWIKFSFFLSLGASHHLCQQVSCT